MELRYRVEAEHSARPAGTAGSARPAQPAWLDCSAAAQMRGGRREGERGVGMGARAWDRAW